MLAERMVVVVGGGGGGGGVDGCHAHTVMIAHGQCFCSWLIESLLSDLFLSFES